MKCKFANQYTGLRNNIIAICNHTVESIITLFNNFRYITVGCGAMKLILKNFASVIKSNIDSPIQTVGVDISREERLVLTLQIIQL